MINSHRKSNGVASFERGIFWDKFGSSMTIKLSFLFLTDAIKGARNIEVLIVD